MLKRRGCLTVPRLTVMSLIKMILVMVSVAAISKTCGLLRFLLRLSFLPKWRLLAHLLPSGSDVDGTDQTSLGQFSGRVQQTYKHSVPRFFVPEHGTMFTLALVRFPPTATKEIQYLNAKGALTYTDIAGDPVLYGNLPPREISMKDVFRSGDSSKKFKIAEGQWYRYAPSYVSPAYHLLE